MKSLVAMMLSLVLQVSSAMSQLESKQMISPHSRACPNMKVKLHKTFVAFMRLGQAACIGFDVILGCVTKCTAVVQTPKICPSA